MGQLMLSHFIMMIVIKKTLLYIRVQIVAQRWKKMETFQICNVVSVSIHGLGLKGKRFYATGTVYPPMDLNLDN